MRRRSELSLRSSNATSLERATAFSRPTVGYFFSNLRKVHGRNNVQPQSLYNFDETGLTTVQKSAKASTPISKLNEFFLKLGFLAIV